MATSDGISLSLDERTVDWVCERGPEQTTAKVLRGETHDTLYVLSKLKSFIHIFNNLNTRWDI
jgi:hypothetical protein